MKVSQERQTPQIKNKQCAQKTLDFRAKYKTQKCRYLVERGYCPYGDMCAFAHDCLQIRNRAELHNQYKTKPCYCRYGDRCLFQHYTDRDRQRTRSNSPTDNDSLTCNELKIRHQTNLKILGKFGFAVFEAYLNRKSSRVLEWVESEYSLDSDLPKAKEDLQEKGTASQSTFQWDSDWDEQDQIHSPKWFDSKKTRMYSL